jgi:ATP-dependent RNA circularization protein (DNA/RNA ligase family)
MKQYHKINTIFKRDMANHGKIMEGVYADPEFEYLKDNTWVFTEKVDGTNIRVMYTGAGVSFGGKTDDAQMPVFLLYKLQELFEGTVKRQLFKEIFEKPNPDGTVNEPQVCLYGEGYGAKIQKGGGNYISDGVSFVLFDVKIGDMWLNREDVEDIANKFGLKIVPILGEGTLAQAVEMTKKGFNSQWGEFISEGLVLRPKVELQTRRGHRIITKIKHKDFI